MAKVNKTKYAILGVLSLKPSSGYDIKKFCDRGISQFWNENFGHIYPVLSKLERDEFVTKKVIDEDGKHTKNVYSITERGREELEQWLMQPIEPAPARLELLLKLTFAKNVNPEVMIKELESILEKHLQRHQKLLKEKEVFNQDDQVKKSDGYAYWIGTLNYGIYDAEFRIKWLKETIENIQYHFQNKEV